MSLGAEPLIIDPGSYLYTANPTERNRFRSTGFHSTVQLDGAEQNPMSADALFAMSDLRRAEALRWETSGSEATFIGRHHGYQRLAEPATHTRRFDVYGDTKAVVITDTIKSIGEHEGQWTFTLAPCDVQIDDAVALAEFENGTKLRIASPQLELQIIDGWFSPSYGRRVATPFLRAYRRTQPGEDLTQITITAD
jgi:hypothetical protein